VSGRRREGSLFRLRPVKSPPDAKKADALRQWIERHGVPEVFNTDQGSQLR
jgi:hypothetical protein